MDEAGKYLTSRIEIFKVGVDAYVIAHIDGPFELMSTLIIQ